MTTIETADVGALREFANTVDARLLGEGFESDGTTEDTLSALHDLICALQAAERDAKRYRWLLSHNAMPSANGDYGTPSIEFHLPEDQQGKWIERGGEDLSRVIDTLIEGNEHGS